MHSSVLARFCVNSRIAGRLPLRGDWELGAADGGGGVRRSGREGWLHPRKLLAGKNEVPRKSLTVNNVCLYWHAECGYGSSVPYKMLL